jgi:hypothetical protein
MELDRNWFLQPLRHAGMCFLAGALACLLVTAPSLGQVETREEGQEPKVRVYKGERTYTLSAGPGWIIGYPDTSPFYFHEWNSSLFYPFFAPWGISWSAMRGAFSPYSGPGATRSSTGRVYLQELPPETAVSVDGSYAGLAGDLGSLILDPGTYLLKLAITPEEVFELSVFVSAGRSVRVTPNRD